MPNSDTAIAQTKKWLSTVVIAQGFCPFAQREFDAGRIHYAVIETADAGRQVEQVIQQCIELDADDSRETSLLIFPTALSNFEAYLDVLDLANAVLEAQDYTGIYQLASFHPEYRFADTPEDDPSQYTNRSPYPMIHILREASVERAVAAHPNAAAIPDRNIQQTQDLGLGAMQALLAACYKI